MDQKAIITLSKQIGVSRSVARELLLLAGGDVALATEASISSSGLNECKARIIDSRFREVEGGEME